MAIRPVLRYSTTLELARELRSQHIITGTPGIPGMGILNSIPLSVWAFMTMLLSLLVSMSVWISFTSANSGSQWMCALATSTCWLGMWRAEESFTSSRAAIPMLSLSMTLLSMASEPSAWAMASWLNSMR